MFWIDAVVNVSLLAADAAALILLWRRRDIRCIPGVVVGYGFAVFVGLVMTMAKVGLFGAMRALAWVIFIHGVILLSGSAVLLWKLHRKVAIGSAAFALLIAVIGVDAFFIEPHWLEVTHVRLSSPKLKRPIRIAILADLQTDEIGRYERTVLKRVSEEKPDFVLLAGDYLQEHDEARRKELIRQLEKALAQAPYSGTRFGLAVEGNCDSPDWTEPFVGNGVKCCKETTTLREGEVAFTALSLADSFDARLRVGSQEGFHIVVGHAPDYALGNVQADLLVAGHTHGGQVRLPLIGPLITLSRVPRSWAAGVTSLSGGRTLIVARGIGMERGPAPRLRFLCRPELVIVEVVPTQ